MSNKTLGKWLEEKYLEWQLKEGARKSLDEFSDYLKTSRPMVSMVMLGKRLPSSTMAYKWAEKLDDETILDLMGLARTDPQYKRLQNLYDAIPPNKREDILDEFENLLVRRNWLQEN